MYVLTARGREIVDDYIRNCAATALATTTRRESAPA